MQSAEYQKEVLNWRMREERRIDQAINIVTSVIHNNNNELDKYGERSHSKFPFLKNFLQSKGTKAYSYSLPLILQKIRDCVKSPEFSDKVLGNSVAILSHSELARTFGGKRSKAGAVLYFLLTAGFLTRVKAEDVKSEIFQNNMKEYIEKKKQHLTAKNLQFIDVKETSLLSVPTYDSDRLRLIEERLQLLNSIHARRSGLTYAYVFHTLGKLVADSIFPLNERLSDKAQRDVEQINDMKAFVLRHIQKYGYFRITMFSSYHQVGRTGNQIKRGYNYSHWKIVQAVLILEGHLVYERAGKNLLQAAMSDKSEEAKQTSESHLIKEDGKWKCPCVLVSRHTYIDTKARGNQRVPLRHITDLNNYILKHGLQKQFRPSKYGLTNSKSSK